ncbi:MAG: hypothetical protein U0133_06490 [Gemmatimonadales bacterium]
MHAGAYHTCGLDLSGTACCWATTPSPELGNGQAVSAAVRELQVGGTHTFTTISVGRFHACGITPPRNARARAMLSMASFPATTTSSPAQPGAGPRRPQMENHRAPAQNHTRATDIKGVLIAGEKQYRAPGQQPAR